MGRRVFLQTYGCQMNERDSEEILGMLLAQGYTVTPRAEDADVILLNTCSVREHAEARALGKMAVLQRLKAQRPDLVLGILGCMAKAHREELFRRLPELDLVAGPAEIYDLPDLLARVAEERQRARLRTRAGGTALVPPARVLAVDRPVRPLQRKPAGDYRARPATAFVTIMEGCDKACAYCIVPMTRGQEVSRPLPEIVEEVERLARAGYRQVTLLGQNVNAYGKRFPDGSGYLGPGRRARLLAQGAEGPAGWPGWAGAADRREPPGGAVARAAPPAGGGVGSAEEPRRRAEAESPAVGARSAAEPAAGGAGDPERLIDFPVLLRAIDARTSIPWVKFTTSHPFDAHERLFRAMAECRSVCEYLHLPVQSGSDRVLRAMRRGYTVASYRAKVARLRELIPEVCLSTDIIVGFPGETEADFEATCRLMAEVQFDSAFLFKYSPRPGTEAARWVDDVPRAVKEARHQRLLALQGAISRDKLARWVGREVEVLVEERNRRGQLAGHTRGHLHVVCEGPDNLIGELVGVRVEAATATTLVGRLV